MKIAYLVCFVALLQVSRSDLSTTLDLNTTLTDLNPVTDLDSSNSTDSNVTEESSDSSTVPPTTSDEVPETHSYSPAGEESSTIEEEEQPTSVKPPQPHNHAAFVGPSILALVVPVCFRLASIKLLGVV